MLQSGVVHSDRLLATVVGVRSLPNFKPWCLLERPPASTFRFPSTVSSWSGSCGCLSTRSRPWCPLVSQSGWPLAPNYVMSNSLPTMVFNWLPCSQPLCPLSTMMSAVARPPSSLRVFVRTFHSPPPSPPINAMSAQWLEMSLLGVGTVLLLVRDAWSMVK